MSHEANEISDGFWKIRQEMSTMRIYIDRFGELVKMISPGRILSMEELHDTLIKERSEMTLPEVIDE